MGATAAWRAGMASVSRKINRVREAAGSGGEASGRAVCLGGWTEDRPLCESENNSEACAVQ